MASAGEEAGIDVLDTIEEPVVSIWSMLMLGFYSVPGMCSEDARIDVLGTIEEPVMTMSTYHTYSVCFPLGIFVHPGEIGSYLSCDHELDYVRAITTARILGTWSISCGVLI